jgi:hypothetical protein
VRSPSVLILWPRASVRLPRVRPQQLDYLSPKPALTGNAPKPEDGFSDHRHDDHVAPFVRCRGPVRRLGHREQDAGIFTPAAEYLELIDIAEWFDANPVFPE